MLELLRCHYKGKHQHWSSAPILVERSIPKVYDTHTIDMGRAEKADSVSTLLPNLVSEMARVKLGLG